MRAPGNGIIPMSSAEAEAPAYQTASHRVQLLEGGT